MNQPDKTFIIPTVKNIAGAKRTIETIYKYTDNFRIILIDNSNENNYEMFRDSVHIYIHPYYNLGFAKSCNTGIRLADTPYVVLCNDDVEFIHKDWWDNAIKNFALHEKKGGKPIGCVNIASIMDRNQPARMEYKADYTQEDWDKLMDWTDTTGVYGMCHLSDIAIDAVCMWCSIIPMKVIKAVGMFDEKFYPGGGEDYDWNRRAYMKGYRVLGIFNSWAWHWWGQTKDKPMTGMPLKKELMWNGFQEKWGKDADVYATKGRMMSYPDDDNRIVPL